MKIRIILVLLLVLLVSTADARRGKTVRKNKPTAEQLAHQEMVNRMQGTTERIMFIDSIVVDKKDFLRAYRLSLDAGTVKPTSDFLRNYRFRESYAYENELGSKCYLSQQLTDSTSMLYCSDKSNGVWEKPLPLQGLNDSRQFRQMNYPFMMGDGITLYFAAEGNDGLGGYDIYMTTYDEETGHYLHPVNIGMPFNSEANDYMYAVDEYDSLGWFATDRCQPEGKVCVYSFVPSSVRQNYDDSEYTPEEISAFARIARISDTWTDSLRLKAARTRLQQKTKSRDTRANTHKIRFYINDDIVYHSPADFRHPQNAHRYQQLQKLQSSQQAIAKSLEKARNYYATAPQHERQQLHDEMLAEERQTTLLHQEIHEMEKTIRNDEIYFLTNNK